MIFRYFSMKITSIQRHVLHVELNSTNKNGETIRKRMNEHIRVYFAKKNDNNIIKQDDNVME